MKTDSRFALVQRSLAGVVLAGVLLGMWGGATPGSPPAGSTEPVIDSVTPDSAAEGAVVTIRGANFGPSVGAVQGTSGVSFNGVWSTPSSWSERSITVAVPPGAETGEVVVTVSGRPSAGGEFTVTGEGASGPAIGTVSPALGLEGTMVTIRGANFGSKGEMGGVSFNGVWASATSWSDEEIRVPVPADATTGGVVVRADGQASNGVAFMVTDSGLGEPVIEFLSADSGPAGMVVTIEGENFGPSIRALEGTSGVSFNGVWGRPTYWSDRVIQVPVPAGAPSGLVTVAVGVEASNGVAFVVERPAPVIEAVDSSFGPEGTRVEITGRNFGPAMEASQRWSGVSFDGVWGVAAYWSDREIRVAAPAGVSSGLIVVSSGGQDSNGIPFTVRRSKAMSPTPAVLASSAGPRATPTLKSLDPTEGPVGTPVKIKGKNLGDPQGTSTVTFNGTPVTNYVSWNNKRIDVEVPEGATTGNVVVTVGGVATAGIEFTVTAGTGPSISSLDPDSGPEGRSVVITGTNFGASQGTSAVTFNGTAATATSWSDTSITAAVPMGATTGDVVVTVDGTASAGVSFTVAPAIGSLSPDSGPEGTTVEITGTSFGAVQGTSTVTFNGTEATPTNWSSTSITAAVPEGATTGDVVVTVDGTASVGASFTVTPAIGSLSPVAGPEGTTVEITGTSFGAMQGTSTVTFNGTEATPTNWSSTSITAAVPEGATTGNVVVTVGGEASNGVSFTVGTDPVISGLNPDSGPAGTSVVITGANFGASQGTSTVTFNGVTALPSTWSDTSITVPVPATAATGPVVVTVGGQVSNGETFTVTLPAPSITGLDPALGRVGAPVAISGENFGATRGTSTVTFNGTPVETYTSWSDASITVAVPEDATTGNVLVTVGGQVSNGVEFTVDETGPGVTVTETTLDVDEGDTGTYQVKLDTQPGASVTVTPTSGETAVATVSPATLTFTSTNWNTAQTVTVTGVEDDDGVNGTATITHTAASSDSGYNGNAIAIGSVEVSVEDNDPFGVVVTEATLDVREGSTGTYQVKLATKPGADVTVTPASGDTAVATASPATLTFTSTNWKTAQTVTVTGVEDDDRVNGTATITHTAASSNTHYEGFTPIGSVVVSVEDNDDPPGVTVSLETLEVTEGTTGTYQVKLATEPGADVTVTPASGDPDVATVSPAKLTFTTSNWSTAQTVTVTAEEDDDYDNETATITHTATSADTGYNRITVGSVAVDVIDNEHAPITLTSNRTSVSEPSGTATITASVPSGYAPEADLTITLAHSGTAGHGASSDYTVGTLTIPANQTSGEATLSVADDRIDEDEETITLTGNATGYQGSDALSIALEDDGDTAGIVVSTASLDVDEGSTGQFQVKLNSEPLNNVTVGIAETSDPNNAISVSDASLTFTSSNWSTYQTVTVTAVEDDSDYADEEATITASASSSDAKYNTTSLNQTVSVSVKDDERPPVTLTSSRSSVSEPSGTATITASVPAGYEPDAPLTIALAHTGTAGHGSSADYTVGTLAIPANRTSETATLTVRDDSIDEDEETITLTGSATGYADSAALSLALEDDDTARLVVSAASLDVDEGRTGQFQVKLGTEPLNNVTVGIAEASAAISVSDTSLTFTSSNWSTYQTVTVTGVEDDSNFADAEATITVSASSSDGKYNTTSLNRTVDVDVEDNDEAQISLTASETSVSEASGSRTATITAMVPATAEPGSDLTISLAHSGSARHGSSADYAVGTLTITAGRRSGTATLAVRDDRIDEGSSETITMTGSASGYRPSSALSIPLNDDDEAGIVALPMQLDVDESNTGRFRVKLNSQPTHSVRVSFSMSLDSSSTVTGPTGSLTFTTSNWNTYQTATVTASSDSDCGNEEATIISSASSSDRKYQGLEKEIDVDVDDDDSPTIRLSSSSSSVSEPSGTATIKATLGCTSSVKKTITLTHSGSADEGDDYTVGTLMINAGQLMGTATLSVLDDKIAEGTETIRLRGSTSGYTSNSTLSIDLNDNDMAGLVVSPTSLTINEAGSGAYTVNLKSEPTANVIVRVSETSDHITRSPASLTFTSNNWSTEKTVTVRARQDGDCADESATVGNESSSSDLMYSGLSVDVHVTVIDDESPTIRLSSDPTSVSEKSGKRTATIKARLGCTSSSEQTINLNTSGTATEGTNKDYTLARSVMIAAGQTEGTATLTVKDDNVCEGTETIRLTGSTDDYDDSSVLSIDLNDNDTAGIVVSPTSLTIDEGKSKGYTVKLNSQPTARVTVGVSETSSDISLSSTSLTFTTSNWGANQTVTVTAAEDNSDYSNESATITHRPSSSDSKYNTTSLNKTVSVSVTDNDTPPPSISSISPPLQPPDTEVTISGSNFGSSQGSVSFGSNSVTDFSSWSNTSIRCFIPAYASAGTVPVKVTTSDGRMSSGYSYTITGQSPFSRGECGEEDDCPAEEKPKKDGSGSEEGGGSEEADDPPGDGG